MNHPRSLLIALSVTLVTSALAAQPNVLLLCVDDLRRETGSYGVERNHTPRSLYDPCI